MIPKLHFDPGATSLPTRQDQKAPQHTGRPRLSVSTHAYWKVLLQSSEPPVAHTADRPRLGRALTHCDNYTPDRVSTPPRPDECPELLDRSACREPLRWVGQSEGLVTLNWNIGTGDVSYCVVFLIQNADLGETLLIHHDSGTRSLWSKPEQKKWGKPVSPATPTRELLGRDRFAYADFMKKDGHKRVLLIESQMAHDRREVLAQMGRDGAQVLKPLTLHTPGVGPLDDAPVWSMVYRPVTDELQILTGTGAGTLLHFSGVMQDAPSMPPRTLDGKHGTARRNLVDDLALYREKIALARKTLDSDTAALLDLCVDVATARNSNLMRSYKALRDIRRHPLVSLSVDLMDRLGGTNRVAGRDGALMDALTDLVDQLLDPGASSGFPPSDRKGKDHAATTHT